MIVTRITLITSEPVTKLKSYLDHYRNNTLISTKECILPGNTSHPMCTFDELPSATRFHLSGRPCVEFETHRYCGFTYETFVWTVPKRKNNIYNLKTYSEPPRLPSFNTA